MTTSGAGHATATNHADDGQFSSSVKRRKIRQGNLRQMISPHLACQVTHRPPRGADRPSLRRNRLGQVSRPWGRAASSTGQRSEAPRKLCLPATTGLDIA
jgi:hypothetical protein